MGSLISGALMSLDGYIADAEGNFDWAAPADDVHAYVNQLERSIGTYLYGRRMYEVMSYWETASRSEPSLPAPVREYIDIWQSAEKIVYSRTLQQPLSAKTRIERSFDVDAIRALKAASPHDISVSGPELAAQALAAELIDEFYLFVVPIVVGDGTPFFPRGVRLNLTLLGEHRFPDGTVYLRYGVIY